MERNVDEPLGRDVDQLLARFGIHGLTSAALMIVFGALIIAFPEMIAWLVGGYLLLAGVIRLARYLDRRPDVQ